MTITLESNVMTGHVGHNSARRMKKPYITSYGIIVYTVACGGGDENMKKFLLIKKRDTYAYIEFLRGLWKDLRDAKKLFTRLTREEQSRILENNFQTLWKDLWIYENSRYYKNGFNRAKRKFSIIEFAKPELKNITTCSEPMWEFPKGRKNSQEDQMTCAFREFEEETLIPKEVLVYKDIHKSMIYQGTDKALYKNEYYICEVNDKYDARFYTMQPEKTKESLLRTSLSDEVEIYGWFDKKECEILLDDKKFSNIANL